MTDNRSRTARAREATSTGRSFQKRVADLYRLLGADVEEDIQLGHKNVDLRATFPLPATRARHSILVECKAEKTNRAQNQRVMEFSGLLDLARKTKVADSAEIVTLKPWSEPAKGFASEAGISLVTFDEKLRDLMDFGPYLASLATGPTRDNAPRLSDYYVTPHGTITSTSTPIPDLLNHLINWSTQSPSSNTPIALLGEYGTGKTSLSQMLARAAAVHFLAAPHEGRIPLLLNLGEFTKEIRIESLVRQHLDHVCGVINPRYQLFDAMHEAGLFLLILDGFDEMAVRTDRDTLELNLVELERLTTAKRGRVILTSRPEYFVSSREQEGAFDPSHDRLTLRKTRYEQLTISPWGDDQLEEFLRRRIPLVEGALEDWTFYRNKIREIPGLADLSLRPVLADMIAKTLPDLLAAGRPVERVTLYDAYLRGELRRQKITKRRRLLISDDHRLAFLSILAAESYTDATEPITFARVYRRIGSLGDLNLAPEDLAAYARDFLSSSFLIRRTGDEFRFSHKSIQEYLAADAFRLELKSANERGLGLKFTELEAEVARAHTFGRQPLDADVLSFLQELDTTAPISRTTLLEIIRNSRYQSDTRRPALAGNALTLLVALEPKLLENEDLTGISVSSSDLRRVDLRTTILNNACLNDVDLRGAKLSADIFVRTKRLEGRFTLCFIGEPRLLDEQAISGLVNALSSGFTRAEARNITGEDGVTRSTRIVVPTINIESGRWGRVGDECGGFFDVFIRDPLSIPELVSYFGRLDGVSIAWCPELATHDGRPEILQAQLVVEQIAGSASRGSASAHRPSGVSAGVLPWDEAPHGEST